MTNDAVRALVDELLAISPEAADGDELARAARLNARLQSFSNHYAMRCSRRADHLKTLGASAGGFAELLDASRSARDAKAAEERDRACATVPSIEDALANGDVSGEHVDVLAKHTRDLTDTERAEVTDRADDITSRATGTSAWNFERQVKGIIRDIKARHRPESAVAELERQRAASAVKRWTDQVTGMKCTLLQLDPLTDAQFHAVVDAKLAELKQDPANATVAFEQLKARAVVEAVTGNGAGMGVPEVNIHTDATTADEGHHDHTLCELADGTPLPVSTMQRFLCDAVVRAVFVEPDGSVRRLAVLRTPNRAQRRALEAIYATCSHPDCAVPVTHCKIHHLVWYSRGGATLLDNLLPVCEQHHHLLHEGGWAVTMTPDRTVTWTRPDGTVWRTQHSPNRAPRSDHPPGRRPAA